MNNNRRFGTLEVIFAVIAVAYVSVALFNRERDNIIEKTIVITDSATAIPITATPASSPLIALETRTPEASQQWYERAQLYLETGDTGAALADVETALSFDSNNPAYFVLRGDIYMQMGLPQMAMFDYISAIEADPTQATTFIKRAEAYRALGDDDAAQSNYQRAFATDTITTQDQIVVYCGMGDIDENLEARLDFYLSAQALGPLPPDCADALARDQRDTGQPQAALQTYNQLLEQHPDHVPALIARAQLHTAAGRYQSAITDLTRSLRVSPENDVALNNRGFAYNKLGNYDRAIADYTASLAYEPDDPITLLNRGSAYQDRGDHQLAIDDFTASIDLDDTNPISFNNRGLSYRALGQNNLAIQDYNTAIELQPESEAGIEYYNRGFLYYQTDRYVLALEDFRTATELMPQDPDTWLMLGDTYDQLGRTTEAASAYQSHISVAADANQPANQRALSYGSDDTNAQANDAPTRPPTDNPSPAPISDRLPLARTLTDVRARSTPSVTAAVVIAISAQETVEILATDDGWTQIRYGSDSGWVLTDALERISAATASGWTQANTVLRVTPAADGEMIRQLTIGERLIITGRNPDSTWLEVMNGPQTGWVPADAVRTTDDLAALAVVR